MKKITLTADEALLKRAQAKARADKTTLTAEFRRWLEDYTAVPETVEQEGMAQQSAASKTNKYESNKSAKSRLEKPGITLARCVDALKKFEKKLEEKL